MPITINTDKLYDTDLTDAAWALIGPMLPAARRGGRPRTTNIRAVLNAIFYLLRTGCQWRLLPREFPVWSTVYHYFRVWKNGVPASSTASRSDSLSVSRHHGWPVGEDDGTWRHSLLRRAQACQRPQASHSGGHLRAAHRMQGRAG